MKAAKEKKHEKKTNQWKYLVSETSSKNWKKVPTWCFFGSTWVGGFLSPSD